MSYIANTPADQQAMLSAIGIESLEELFESIPAELRLNRPLELAPALGELELTQHLTTLGARNEHTGSKSCFLGGGSYDHFIPSVVDAIASRGEFYTSYTPYQPEVSQGNLQAMFEYQSLVCDLTGMDVSNASLYDGGSAATEAVLMCMHTNRREAKVVTVGSVHPEYRSILATYLANLGTELVTVPTPGGVVDLAELEAAVNDQTACVLLQSPNFFGCVEDIRAAAEIAHAAGASLIQSFDPISLGLLARPGDMGVDVVVAEGQSLGNPMAFGGPYLGLMACSEKFMRRMPGRIAGETVDRRGRRCWVLTLQTREQHIRREKATSNICTNQTLLALRSTIYLATMGTGGLSQVANLCVQKSHYAAETLTADDRFELAFDQPYFKEFVLRDREGHVRQLLADAVDAGQLAGIDLGRWYPELDDCFLVAVTEQRTRQEIDALARQLTTSNQPQAALHA